MIVLIPKLISVLSAVLLASNINEASALRHRVPASHDTRNYNYMRSVGVQNATAPLAGFQKRGGDSRFTYYAVGQGACGGTNSPNEFVVALTAQQWDGGSHCYDTVTISYNGKTAQAQIVDECMGCPYGALDFSEGLMSYFVAPRSAADVGQISGSWSFGSGGGSSGGSGGGDNDETTTSTTTTHKKTTTTEKPTSTSTTTTSTSTTHEATTTSTRTTSSKAKTSSTTSQSATSTSSAVVAEETGSNTDDNGTLSQLSQALLQIAGIAIASVNAN